MEAIVAATKHGGEIMMQGGELGQIKEGYLADLLLVDGDPVSNLAILQDQRKILAIMKDGVFHKKRRDRLGPLALRAVGRVMAGVARFWQWFWVLAFGAAGRGLRDLGGDGQRASVRRHALSTG